jgi:hypothetical protein
MPAAGDEIVSSDVSGLEDLTTGKPIGRLVQTVAQTGIASNTATAATFTTEDIDTHNFHDTGTNPSRVTPDIAGFYRVNGSISLAGATDYTILQALIRKNGSTSLPPAYRSTGVSTSSQSLVFGTQALVDCNGSTDYFEVVLIVSKSAGTISTVVSVQFACVLEWTFERSA